MTEIGSRSSGSVPVTGNAIESVGEEDPFIVTYSLDDKPDLTKIFSDIKSLKSSNATAFEEQRGGREMKMMAAKIQRVNLQK